MNDGAEIVPEATFFPVVLSCNVRLEYFVKDLLLEVLYLLFGQIVVMAADAHERRVEALELEPCPFVSVVDTV